jgi:uncharacterized protein
MNLRFSRIPGQFAICRLAADAEVPTWGTSGGFFSVSRTADELSIVCAADAVPHEVKSEAGWACLKLEGPFPFTVTGVLSAFLVPLAEARISIFAISTFDTDYVLVKEEAVEAAIVGLQAAGHQLSAK